MRAPFEQLKHSAAQSADLLQRVLSFLARQQLPNDSQELDSRFVQIFRSHPERLSKKYPRHGIRVADLISGDTTKFTRFSFQFFPNEASWRYGPPLGPQTNAFTVGAIHIALYESPVELAQLRISGLG
jgi:hypothetical protein